jgi:hypothetical protein
LIALAQTKAAECPDSEDADSVTDDGPSWAMLSRLANGNGLSEDGTAVAQQLLNGLADLLGPDWPAAQYARSGRLPSELLLLSTHRAVLPQFLAFVLRLSEAKSVPTFKPVLAALRKGVDVSTWRHTLLQLEVGRVCREVNTAYTFEPSIPGSVHKADLQVEQGEPAPWLVETTTVLRGDVDKAWERYEDRFRNTIRRIEYQHGATCICVLNDHADEGITEQWLAAVETAAAAGAGQPQQVSSPAGTVTVLTGPPPAGTAVFTGAAQFRNGWHRLGRTLADKARQTKGPLPAWIRVDCLDGLFQFTEWARMDPERRTAEMADAIRQNVSWPAHARGVVLSTGAGLSIGATDPRVENDDARTADGIFVRRLLSPHLARETFIIPLTVDAVVHADLWAAGYGAEPSWLDADLAAAGLPSLAQFWKVAPAASDLDSVTID